MSDTQPGPTPESEGGDIGEKGPESPWAEHPETEDLPANPSEND